MAEGLLRAEDKGAVAAFMSTGMTAPEGQHIMNKALFDALFTRDIRTLGEAVSSAKQVLLANGAEYEETSETFHLFGDPAMRLKIPLPGRPPVFAAQGQQHRNRVTLSWEAVTDCNGNPVVGYNLYRATKSGGPYKKVNTELITETTYTDNGEDINIGTALVTGTTQVSSGLANGTTYYYVVKAVDEDGVESAPTTELSITTGSAALSVSTSGAAGGGGGCFIGTVSGTTNLH